MISVVFIILRLCLLLKPLVGRGDGVVLFRCVAATAAAADQSGHFFAFKPNLAIRAT